MKNTNAIGLGLVTVCFILSLGRIVLREAQEHEHGIVTIRFAHWQLESGVRQAFDEIARQYMKLHGDVRVEQLVIPERIYPNWIITQLVGGTAPDLVELGKGAEGDRIGRFFVSLSDYVDQPNPYNKGTSLEGVPWRETFLDGLVGPPSFNEDLLEYYGIPNTINTIRIYYNRDLLKKITGHDSVTSGNYREFLALCEKVQKYSGKSQRVLIPISGSRYNAPFLLDDLFASQTQKMVMEQQLIPTLAGNQDEFFLRYLQGKWALTSPEIRLGFQLEQEVGHYFQPGFLQLDREDAMLYFIQGRALMTATGSWDLSSVYSQVSFPVGVFKLPYPTRDDPVYGHNGLGAASEAGRRTDLVFGLTNSSRNREAALDFLRFMTSKQSSQIFTDISGWLPAVTGIKVPERTKPFYPLTRGAIGGLSISYPNRESDRVVRNNLYLLFQPGGNFEDFARTIEVDYRDALIADLEDVTKERITNVCRQDTMLAAQVALAEGDKADYHMKKAAFLSELQTAQDLANLYYPAELKKLGIAPTH